MSNKIMSFIDYPMVEIPGSGIRVVDLNISSDRYIRMTVSSTWSASTDTKHYKQLRIDEVYVGSNYASSSAAKTYEAENGALSGAAVSAASSASSGGYKVKFIGNSPSNFVTINNVNVSSAGSFTMTINYLVNGTRTFYVSVNGGSGTAVPVSGTDFNAVASIDIPVNLQAGNNTIKIYNDTAYAPDLDNIVIK